MLLIIGHLDFTTTSSFIHSFLHRLRNLIRIHDNVPITISGSTSNRLDKPTFITKETFLISIQNSNQTNFRNVNTLTKKVNPNKNIKDTQTQVTDNLSTLQSLNIRVHVFDLDSHFLEVIGQVLSHLLSQSCYKDTLSFFSTGIDFTKEVIHLTHSWTNFDFWIKKSCRTDDLLNDSLSLLHLIVTWCR